MLRTRSSRLVLTSAGLAAAAIIGVQLGQSAISEINPIHFQGPLERPRAIEPPPPAPAYDPYGQPYVWSIAPQPALADCGPDCDADRTRQAVNLALAETAGRDPSLPYWRDATPTTELRPWRPGAVPERRRDVERYLHYPVNEEQAGRAAATATPAPAPALAPAPANAARPQPAAALSVEPLVED